MRDRVTDEGLLSGLPVPSDVFVLFVSFVVNNLRFQQKSVMVFVERTATMTLF